MNSRILIVDDDGLVRSFLVRVLEEHGHLVEQAASGGEALGKLVDQDFAIVITDLRMADISGMDLMREARRSGVETKWIIITAYGSIGNAVEAMKEGASDYLTKPLAGPDELRRVVHRVLKEIETDRKISLLSEELGRHYPPIDMIFTGKQMAAVRRLVESVSPTSATVLISGPSGTGKELVARCIHQFSPRKDRPFVVVHCASLAETLLESELFGHEKGAFTGALAVRKGRFEQADGGTIFLDEIGEISPAVQVKLLRVLQEKAFERVGGNKTISVDLRIISATNRDLMTAIASGHFRDDLYYRLNVFPITLPPLSERTEAIVSMAEYFINKYSESVGKKVSHLSPEACATLLAYRWPGNVRELQNVIERAVILAGEAIEPEHLGLPEPEESPLLREGLLHEAERKLIEEVLKESGGNRKKAAKRLGVSLRTLQYRVKEYGL